VETADVGLGIGEAPSLLSSWRNCVLRPTEGCTQLRRLARSVSSTRARPTRSGARESQRQGMGWVGPPHRWLSTGRADLPRWRSFQTSAARRAPARRERISPVGQQGCGRAPRRRRRGWRNPRDHWSVDERPALWQGGRRPGARGSWRSSLEAW